MKGDFFFKEIFFNSIFFLFYICELAQKIQNCINHFLKKEAEAELPPKKKKKI